MSAFDSGVGVGGHDHRQVGQRFAGNGRAGFEGSAFERACSHAQPLEDGAGFGGDTERFGGYGDVHQATSRAGCWCEPRADARLVATSGSKSSALA